MPSGGLITCLGVSHADFDLARWWIWWTTRLSLEQEDKQTIVVICTRRAWAGIDRLKNAAHHTECMDINWQVCPDEKESGYPGSASHLFYRALEYCERYNKAVLWIEPDAIPIRPTWLKEIEAEYEACPKLFLGVIAGCGFGAHMAGVGVYPRNWRELSPCLSGILSNPSTLPDISFWGPGKGQAWDTGCAPEIVPQVEPSKTIAQMWRPAPFTEKTVRMINPSVTLLHQCKDLTLMRVLAGMQMIEIDC